MWTKKLSYLFLAIGFLGFTFCEGRFNFPASAWIWPAALLLFFHTEEGRKRYTLTALALGAGYAIKMIGALDSSIILDISLGFLCGLVYVLPFFADSIIGSRFRGLIRTLAFPLAWTSVEFLQGFTAVGAWNAIGYSQTGFSALIQFSSIFGIYGVTFIILWTGSVIAYLTEYRREAFPAALTCTLALALILTYGAIQLNNIPSSADSVKVAGICGPVLEKDENGYIDISYDENAAYLEKTVNQASENKAKMLVYNEEAFSMDDTYEDAFTELACSLAEKYSIYIILGLELADTDNSYDGLSCNLIKFIDSSGVSEWTYTKTKLVPVMETFDYVKGDGDICYADTDFGRVTSLICFDNDSPQFVHKVNEYDPDLLVIPAWEWEGIYENHTRSLKVRAIENGIPVVKVSYDGIHFAADCSGNTIAEVNTYTDGADCMMTADIPLASKDTIYSRAGAYIDWIFIISLIAMAAAAAYRKRKS